MYPFLNILDELSLKVYKSVPLLFVSTRGYTPLMVGRECAGSEHGVTPNRKTKQTISQSVRWTDRRRRADCGNSVLLQYYSLFYRSYVNVTHALPITSTITFTDVLYCYCKTVACMPSRVHYADTCYYFLTVCRMSVLHHAVLLGNVDIIQALLDHGSFVDMKDAKG